MEPGATSPIMLHLADDSATAEAGSDIVLALPPGITVHLHGDLGAGKTALARAMIRTLMKDQQAEVPSPTFSLVQHYELPETGKIGEILHADLYRISEAGEVHELGLDQGANDRLVLIEWPQNGLGELPEPDLAIELTATDNRDGSEGRQLSISGRKALLAAVRRSLQIRGFLDTGWQKGVVRAFLLGDASTRSYETARAGEEIRILMNAPRQPDGPVIRDNKPYSRIAHLAEDVSAFVGVRKILHQLGFRVPTIHHQDLEGGLLLIENLGTGQIITPNRLPVAERYIAAAQMLAELHQKDVVRQADPGNGKMHVIPDYDRGAMAIETELLSDWYAPAFKGSPLAASELKQFRQIWDTLFEHLSDSEKHIVLRDFHSPNIIWQEKATGSQRIGLIDFQDAMIGPTAYDVASLAQDARIDISPSLEADIIDAYISARTGGGDFDEARFRQDYAIMAAQRATKILGIFVRLNVRDGKPAYLAHLPRMRNYIERSLKHPVLADYRTWFQDVIGEAETIVTKT